MSALIRCEHVDFGYENHDAVIDVSMEINPGDYLCILGENGSGKSTLMKGILGLLKPTAGTLVVDEELRRTGIGYLPQQTAAQRDFPATVYEVVRSGCLSHLGRRPFFSRADKALAMENMEKLGIAGLSRKCYRELSGGQQQRVLIARALINEPELMILDEPETGLDFHNQILVLNMIERLSHDEGICAVMNTHYPTNALSVSDYAFILDNKGSFMYGPTEEVLNETNISRSFEVRVAVNEFQYRGKTVKSIVPVSLAEDEEELR